MNDLWQERLKIVLQIVIALGTLAAAIGTILNRGQIENVKAVQSVQSQKLDAIAARP